MRKTIYILSVAMGIFFCQSCNDDTLTNFDEDEGLKTEFPESLFEFEFDYTPYFEGEQIAEKDSFHYPIPLDHDSFTNFYAESEVKNNSGIRFVRSILNQSSYLIDDTLKSNNFIPIYASRFGIKLNVATSGDAINGELYEKETLLDFLQEGKTYPTVENQLGAIELTYQKYHEHLIISQGDAVNMGINSFGDIGASDYSVKVVSVEDYDDLTREGELIKSALRVVIEFEGLIGASSDPDLPANIRADQWDVENGRATFIVDYLQ